MKLLTTLLLLLCFVSLQIGASTYNIGPGRTYTDGNAFDASVGWHTLQAGDIVRIHKMSKQEHLELGDNGIIGRNLFVRRFFEDRTRNRHIGVFLKDVVQEREVKEGKNS